VLTQLILPVGAFERPTPCAQGSFQPQPKMPYFQLLTFQSRWRDSAATCGALWNPEALASYSFVYSGIIILQGRSWNCEESGGSRQHAF
jgi:hypothetical protein